MPRVRRVTRIIQRSTAVTDTAESRPFRSAVRQTLQPLVSLFFPAHCAGCGCRVGEGDDFCEECRDEIRVIQPPRCEVCSQPYDGVTAVFQCPNCRGEAFHFECAVAVVRSRGPVREMVHRLKYGRELWLGRVLAEIALRGFDDPRLSGVGIDALVPVPLHARRLREREFNQSEILAKNLSPLVGIPVAHLLARRRYTTTQTQLDRRGRRQNLRDAFVVRKNAAVTDRTFLLVDDVLTTGSTLDACAAALLGAGAASVFALTVARG